MGEPSKTASERLALAAEVIRTEARTIARLEELLDQRFADAVGEILDCRGQVVVTGMGKAGLVGQKISATLASTGTPSFFLHAAEALHGDLGRLREQDLLLAISNSGETEEVTRVVPLARKFGARVVGMTGNDASTLAKLSDHVLNIGLVEEACPLKLAPTASTSAMLALGDALAMVVLAERGFDRDDYARYHPAGNLGRKLLTVAEVMRKDEYLPLVPRGTKVVEVLIKESQTPGKPGAALVIDDDGRLAGIFTDGDLRRLLERADFDLLNLAVEEFMGRDPKTLKGSQLAEEAHHLLSANKIDQAPVVDDEGRPVGLLDVQDLLDIGM